MRTSTETNGGGVNTMKKCDERRWARKQLSNVSATTNPPASSQPERHKQGRPSTQTSRRQAVLTDPKVVRNTLVGELPDKLMPLMAEWENPTARELVADYVTSLINGDGSQPSGLCSSAAAMVQKAFGDVCLAHNVGYAVLPAQRLEWYRTLIGLNRSQRSHRNTKKKLANAS